MNKFELLEKTAAWIRSAPDYSWGHSSRCNVGLLIEVARGSRATREEFFQRNGGHMWCHAADDNHVLAWLRAEYGFTPREIESIELLNDKSIVRLLARRGVKPASLFNKSRQYVAAYVAAMAAREKRRAAIELKRQQELAQAATHAELIQKEKE